MNPSEDRTQIGPEDHGLEQARPKTAQVDLICTRNAGNLDLEGGCLTVYDSGNPASFMIILTGFDCTVNFATIHTDIVTDELVGILITIEPDDDLAAVIKATEIGEEMPSWWLLEGLQHAITAPFQAADGDRWLAGVVLIKESLAVVDFAEPEVYEACSHFNLTGQVFSYCLVPQHFLGKEQNEADFDSGWVTLPVLLVNEIGREYLGLELS